VDGKQHIYQGQVITNNLKIKLLLFTSISGGSWIYALKFLNMSKLSDLQKELREIKNG
jgi:hypothetical protein